MGSDSLMVTCGACGKKHPRDPGLAGKPFKCVCGNVVLAPVSAALAVEEDPYDLADPAPPAQSNFRPPRAAPTAIASEAVVKRLGVVPRSKKVAPDSAAQTAAREMEKMLESEPVRDFVIPSILIAIGLILSFYEVMHTAPHAPLSPAKAAPLVIGRAILSAGLMLGAIFLATGVFEVCLVGNFKDCIFKLAAVAIAPSAIYGICCYAIGDVGGSATGALLAMLAYGLLFRFLMRLDLKDTSVCVIITWVLITAVNYAAYKVQGAMQDSWI